MNVPLLPKNNHFVKLCRYLFIKAGSELYKFAIVAQVSEIAPGLYVQYVNIEITHVS